eukprot:gene19860-biopygen5534
MRRDACAGVRAQGVRARSACAGVHAHSRGLVEVHAQGCMDVCAPPRTVQPASSQPASQPARRPPAGPPPARPEAGGSIPLLSFPGRGGSRGHRDRWFGRGGEV